jgi:REP element-mobilizing transposase RayT
MYHRRPPRLPADCYTGFQRVFLTMCSDQRRIVFGDPLNATAARDELLRTADACAVEVIAYCFMPDHLHALFEGLSADSELISCADLFRRRSGLAYRSRERRRLWQQGYFDRLLRSDETTIPVVKYILENPVRAGLVRDPGDYPYSGSSRYSLEQLADCVQWRPQRGALKEGALG